MIVLTSPTGAIGAKLLDLLLAQGAPLRVIARDPSKLPGAAHERAEIVQGSHGDAAIVDRAFAGASAVFWLAPPNPAAPSLAAAYTGFSRPAVEAVRTHGVPRVVGVSALGRGTPWEREAGLVTASFEMDDLFAASGAAYRALALPSFMDNVLRQAAGIRDGVFTSPLAGDRPHPTCCTADIAAAAARWLQDGSWTGVADAPVLGPEDLSGEQMAAIMAEVLGHPVRFAQVPLDAFEARLRSAGMSEAYVAGYMAMMAAKDKGLDDAVARTPATASPTTFRRWFADAFGA